MTNKIDKMAILNLTTDSDIILAVSALETGLYVRSIRIHKYVPTTNLKITIKYADNKSEQVVCCMDDLLLDCRLVTSATVNMPAAFLIEYSVGRVKV
jgi:hypothetical protein